MKVIFIVAIIYLLIGVGFAGIADAGLKKCEEKANKVMNNYAGIIIMLTIIVTWPRFLGFFINGVKMAIEDDTTELELTANNTVDRITELELWEES